MAKFAAHIFAMRLTQFHSSVCTGILAMMFSTWIPQVSAQVPGTLKLSIHPPASAVGVQTGTSLGTSVAVEGPYAVAGVPNDSSKGSVKVFDSATRAVLFVLTDPNPNYGAQFGASVAISGTRVVVGAPMEDTFAVDGGMAFVYDLAGPTPTTPIARLWKPGAAQNDQFGNSVAISGTRVAVGAANDNSGAAHAGKVFVYDVGSGQPDAPMATLSESLPGAQAFFGKVVAMSGARLMVGTGAGRAYVYNFGSGIPSGPEVAFAKPASASSTFGFSVAISGTLAVVGSSTAAYVYDVATPGGPPTALPNPGSIGFGTGVAVSGFRVAVTNPFQKVGGATNSGTAYVFNLASASPTVVARTIANPEPEADNDYFGKSVSLSGDLLMLGTPGDNYGAADAGTAYVYNLSGGEPIYPTFSSPSPDRYGGFQTVAMAGTRVVANAGIATCVFDLAGPTPTVPSYKFDFAATQVGVSGSKVLLSNYSNLKVYDLDGPTPALPSFAMQLYGYSSAISGSTVVVGRPQTRLGSGLAAGTVGIYDLNSATPTTEVLTLINPDQRAQGSFGSNVAILGTKVVVAGGSDPSGSTSVKVIYVYDLASATPAAPLFMLKNPNSNTNALSGLAMAMSGSQLVVGDYVSNRVFVYDFSSAAPSSPTVVLQNAATGAYQGFGYAVAISGARLVVGTPQYNSSSLEMGAAFLYDLASATPAVSLTTLFSPFSSAHGQFGQSVAVDGDNIAVIDLGLSGESSVMGVVRIFGPSAADTDADGLPDSWEIEHFGATVGHSALDDIDGDGRTELVEFALNSDPLVPDSLPGPSVTQEGGYLTMTVTKRPGVQYLVQSAGTFTHALASSEDLFSAGTTVVLIDDATTLKVRDVVPISQSSKRFMRLKVTPEP